mmetsp:Transcript_12769/g.33333  ORF Transcript_12769/g.33333 Transcript_12769/m.33333 type:complete len:230 (+) Transcript_12769:2761-3450(+)
MHAAAVGKSGSSVSDCIPSMFATPSSAARYGSSPNVSYTRDHDGCVESPRIGAKSHGTPAASVSRAVTRPDARAISRSNVAPSAIWCPKSVAPYTYDAPCTESSPYRMGGTPSSSASCCTSWMRLRHSDAVQPAGTEWSPHAPPEYGEFSSEPTLYLRSHLRISARSSLPSFVTRLMSICVICPTFSSMVMSRTSATMSASMAPAVDASAPTTSAKAAPRARPVIIRCS